MTRKHILVDGREFCAGKQTGIGRFLDGLIDCLVETPLPLTVTLACFGEDYLPARLRNRKPITGLTVPSAFLKSEKALSDYTRQGVHLFISPYRKLPLFGVYCPSVHTIHDVFDLTQPAYKRRLKSIIDRYRLKKDLNRADLTWYDSEFSMYETKKIACFSGNNPKIRYPGIEDRFNVKTAHNELKILKRYNLEPGYVLVIGNGMPHKNLSALLKISKKISRKLVFVGVSEASQASWKKRCPNVDVAWIDFAADQDLPCIIRGAFCLAQPSTAEGYGYPPLEAMACGVPAVVSSIPVLMETTGGFALTADPFDSDSWLDALNKLEDSNYYKKQVKKGLSWLEQFRGSNGWGKYVSDVQELISA